MIVADFIMNFLAEKGLDTVFVVTGGQAMFLNDAVCKNKKITPIFTHHEQAAAMAAEAYGRISNKIGIAMVTAGPGGINALTGVVGAWTDSSPMIILAGQSALSKVEYMDKTNIRQYGLQGINMRPVVQSVVKDFITIDDPSKIQYYMEKAYYLATSGRKGPVWIDVPLDIQRMEVPKKLLQSFEVPVDNADKKLLKDQILMVIESLKESKRPIIILGQGVRLANAQESSYQLIEKLNVPVVTTRLGIDLIETDNKLFVGRPGLYGDRASNFAIQNSDLIIAIGARLDPGIIGYDTKDWGRNAKKIIIDIDIRELNKSDINNVILRINSDAKLFLEEFLSELNKSINLMPSNSISYENWVNVCNDWKKRYPMVLESYQNEQPINSYYLIERLSLAAKNNDTIVVDTSSPFHVVCQTWKIKNGQRFITTGGISTMGYWPACIGACMANKGKRTIVITGDGCLQMNIQELATLKQTKLPIKVFIFNNNGYLLIRHTQMTHLGGRLMGESPKTGLWLPDAMKIADAYGIKGIRISSVSELDQKIKEALEYGGPVICDVMTPEWQLIIPRISSERKEDGSMVSKPYEDLYPFLDRDEFAKNMSIGAADK